MLLRRLVTLHLLIQSALSSGPQCSAQDRTLLTPFAFVENRGQWPPTVSHGLRVLSGMCWFEADGWVLSLCKGTHRYRMPTRQEVADQLPARVDSVSLRMNFVDARSTRARGVARRSARILYGRDVSAPAFDQLRYPDIGAGIDVVVRESGGRFAYDIFLAPGARLDDIVIRTSGVDRLRLLPDGRLVMTTALGDVLQTRPVTWEVLADGRRRALHSRFRVLGPDRYGFLVDDWHGHTPLVIDPGLDWSTFFGGSGGVQPNTGFATGDEIYGLALDDRGRILVTGEAFSLDFPTTMGPGLSGPSDAYVALIDPQLPPTRQLVWSRYLGGDGNDVGFDVAYDSTTGLYAVVGMTDSPWSVSPFPTTTNGVLQTARSGASDGFVAELDAGGQLLFSSLLGGDAEDRVTAVEASGGTLVLGGFTSSKDFPVSAGAYQPTWGGNFDAFITRLPLTLAAVLQSTYLGGSHHEGRSTVFPPPWNQFLDLMDLHVSDHGEVTITGRTRSSNFPTTPGALQPAFSRGQWGDVFISRLDYGLGSLQFSTFFGGDDDDAPTHLDVDRSGVITLGGWTCSTDLMMAANALQSVPGGDCDGFIAQLDPGSSGAAQLRYSTYLGGPGNDWVSGLAVEPSSGIVVAGGGAESGFRRATRGAHLGAFTGTGMGYVLRLLPTGGGAADLHYFSYVGAGALQQQLPGPYEAITQLALRPDGRVVLGGYTDNPRFPTTSNAMQSGFPGTVSAVTLTIMDLLPAHTYPFGASSPICAPPMYPQVGSDPWRGNPRFELYCIGAPGSATGVLLFGHAAPLGGPALLGAVPYVVLPATVAVPARSDAAGFARFAFPVPASLPSPLGVAAQWTWLVPAPCGGATLAGSSALEIR